MKRFSIFRKGTHTASSGTTLAFSAADLRRAAQAYDPAISQAPIVVGHPTLNGPAYGWISALHFNEATGENEVDSDQVEESFAEMVAAGRFRNRSASWYMPGSTVHPLAGQPGHDAYYLRHVGFLGAQAPAVKGLKPVEFASSDDGIVEFADSMRWAWGSMAAALRGMREWVIGKFNLEEGDKAVPNYLISDIERAAEEARAAGAPAATAAYSEGNDMPTVQELQTQLAAKDTEITALKAKQMPTDFAEREGALAAREAAVKSAEAKAARATIEARVGELVKAGKVLPAQKTQIVDFALCLADAEAAINFGEGDKAKKVTQREAYLLQLEAGPKLVDYSERSGDKGDNADGRPPLAEVQSELRNQVFSGGAPAKKA